MRLFEEHATPCHVVAELWSFENIQSFVQAEVGLAIVPRVTVEDELADGKLAHVPVAELHIPRRTLMIYRDQGYVSDSAQELIKIVRGFSWADRKVTSLKSARMGRLQAQTAPLRLR